MTDFYILNGNIVESSVPGLGIPSITSADRVNAISGTAFTYTITATQSPTVFSADWLPYGLSLNPATGVISGTIWVNSVGEFRFTLEAANAIGTGRMVLTIDVAPAVVPPPPVVEMLLSAVTYAVLAETGVSNTGDTVLTGDLGISPNNATSITGFPPGTYSGILHAGDIVAAQALADATAASVTLKALTPTTDISSTDLGGYVAVAGNYNATAAGTWSAGPLTCNAAGDPNAQFVFVFGTALTMPASATVVLENGAQANNVYFVTGSAFTFGANCTVNGNILAGTSIIFASDSVLNGRALIYGPSGTDVTFPSAGVVTVPAI